MQHAPKVLTPANVIVWMQLATLQELPNIITSAKQLIAKSFSKVSLDEHFLSMGLAEVKDMITAAVEENATPDDVLKAVSYYKSHDREDRIKDLDVLIQHIKFHHCSATALKEIQDNYTEMLLANPASYKRLAESVIKARMLAEASKPLSVIVLGMYDFIILNNESIHV